jgi:uncharacterized protein YkwD
MLRDTLGILVIFGVILSQNLTAKGNDEDRFERATTRDKSPSNITPQKLISVKDATMGYINKLRAKPQKCSSKPAPALKWNEELYKKAKEHSIDMALNNFLSHTGSGKESDVTAQVLKLGRGSTFPERMNQGKKTDRFSVELLAAVHQKYYKTPKEILDFWIKGGKTCREIMNPKVTDVAIAKVINHKTKKAYWTLILSGKKLK